MKERVAGISCFIVGVGAVLVLIAIIADEASRGRSIIDLLPLFLICAPVILYPAWTRFGKRDLSEVEKLDIQNEILKKQIEQKELKKKLED